MRSPAHCTSCNPSVGADAYIGPTVLYRTHGRAHGPCPTKCSAVGRGPCAPPHTAPQKSAPPLPKGRGTSRRLVEGFLRGKRLRIFVSSSGEEFPRRRPRTAPLVKSPVIARAHRARGNPHPPSPKKRSCTPVQERYTLYYKLSIDPSPYCCPSWANTTSAARKNFSAAWS